MTTRLFGVLLYAVMFSGLLGGMAFAQPLCSPVGVPERLISVDYNDEEVSYGTSVAISGNTLVIGTPNLDAQGSATFGGAYVYTRTSATAPWSLQATLVPSRVFSSESRWGVSVAIDGNTIAIAGEARFMDAATIVAVFTRAGSTWTQQVKLIAGVGLAGDRLGSSVAVQPGRIVAGAPLHGLFDEGGAFLFVRDNAVWRQRPPIYGINGVLIGDHFGSAVAMNSSSLLVGSPFENNENGVDAGAAYLYDFFICLADYNCSGSLSVQDLLDFLTGYFAQSSAADTNGSGTWTVQDIFDFLAGYFAGCS